MNPRDTLSVMPLRETVRLIDTNSDTPRVQRAARLRPEKGKRESSIHVNCFFGVGGLSKLAIWDRFRLLMANGPAYMRT